MARSQRTFPYTDLLILLGRLPWWINLVFALLSWLLLHPYAISALPLFRAVPSGGVLAEPLFRQLASYAQYLLPLAFCTAALVTLGYRFAQRRRRVSRPPLAPAEQLQAMDWKAFMRLLEQGFRHKGYRLLGNTLAEADGSCDLLLQLGSERYLVLCRHWRSRHVGMAPLRGFFARVVSEGAAGGFVVSIGDFADDARAFAADRQIELLDGARLQRWLRARQGG